MTKRTPIFLPLILAVILAVGLALAWTAISAWSYSLLTTGRGYVDWETIQVDWDGTPLIQKYSNDTQEQSYRTLEGEKLKKDRVKGIRTLLPASFVGSRALDAIEFPLADLARIQPIPDPNYDNSQADNDEKRPMKFWYFVHDGKREGKGYFAGFDSKTKQSIGYLGREGFRRDVPPQDTWFPMDGRLVGEYVCSGISPASQKGQEPNRNSMYFGILYSAWKTLMISGDELLQIDWQTGKTISLFKKPGMISLTFIGDNREPYKKENESEYLPQLAAVRTVDEIVTFDPTGKFVHTFAIPESLRDKSFSFFDIGPGHGLINVQKKYFDVGTREQLVWVDAAGKILREKEVDLSGRGYRRNTEDDFGMFAVYAESPLAMSVFGVVIALDETRWMEGQVSYSEALAASWSKAWLPLLFLVIISAVFACVCYRRQRRYALPWTWIWVVFVFLLGIPGYLGYRFHRRWAVMDECPTCKKKVPHDRESCAACATPFPLPERKGTEIFA